MEFLPESLVIMFRILGSAILLFSSFKSKETGLSFCFLFGRLLTNAIRCYFSIAIWDRVSMPYFHCVSLLAGIASSIALLAHTKCTKFDRNALQILFVSSTISCVVSLLLFQCEIMECLYIVSFILDTTSIFCQT